MASISAGSGTKLEKPSFANIAATGLKPSNGPQTSRTNNNNSSRKLQSQEIGSLMRHDQQSSPPSIAPVEQAAPGKPKQLVQLMAKDVKDGKPVPPGAHHTNVSGARAGTPGSRANPTGDGLFVPISSDEAGTQLSSSSDSAKPASIDGKSVTSGTTFGLDEKESLRPDDSASVKAAAEDEDASSTAISGLPDSRLGSDDGVRAFRDQLHEIHSMDRTRPDRLAPSFEGNIVPPHAALFLPSGEPDASSTPAQNGPPLARRGDIDFPPDPKLLEALESPRDRIWVLKLEQDIIDFVKDPKESSLNLPQCNSFYRMLAHKIADYYMLGHLLDDSVSAVRLYKGPHCRLPPPLTGIATPSTAASTPPPAKQQLKILRRGDAVNPSVVNGSNVTSKTTSENGESGEEVKAPATREEREARYEAARLRIMGSAKPSESGETPKDVDESRASSATGKKSSKKNKRNHSDDDFEPRATYNTFLASSTGAHGGSSAAFGFVPPGTSDDPASPAGYASADLNHQAFQPSNPQGAVDNMWPYPPFAGSAQPWPQTQPASYDLSAEFQRTMSFQQQQPFDPNLQYQYNSMYQQQQFMPPQSWPQYGSPYQPNQGQISFGYQQQTPARPASSPSQPQQQQPYAYGQLPSQTFPGRPASKLEHPIPGSYKSQQHFNPQSQAFVPGQNSPMRPFAPPRTPSGYTGLGVGFGAGSPSQRQNLAPPQGGSNYGSPQTSNVPLPARYPNQPVTHPLPQPVFARRPSPVLPLPPKPQTTPQKQTEQQEKTPSFVGVNGEAPASSISKWGVPASLPAKPPPSNVAPGQGQQQPFTAASPHARPPVGMMPTFGSMPYMPTGNEANTGNTATGKR